MEKQTAAETSPQNQPTSITLEASDQVAAVPTETQPAPGDALLPEPSVQQQTPGVNALLDAPVYIGHTDRVTLQPDMVRALRQLIDTSYDGLQVRTHPNGTQIVDTPNKFRHVAVAAMTPDRKVLQQDFSTSP